MIELFDSHAHLQASRFDADREAVLLRARAAGVSDLLIIGEDERSSHAAVALAGVGPRLWAAVGLHPHDARTADEGFDARLSHLARAPRVVAIGEIGLDFHYDRSPRNVQADLFRRQLALAVELNLPVVVHSREAEAETFSILAQWSAERRVHGGVEPFGVMHCFGYDASAAGRFIALGFMISIAGPVTYPRAEIVQAAARAVPDHMLLIETDAPVLTPQAHRGRRNEPAYLVETASRVAELRGTSLDALGRLTAANARRLFRLAAPPAVTALVGSHA